MSIITLSSLTAASGSVSASYLVSSVGSLPNTPASGGVSSGGKLKAGAVSSAKTGRPADSGINIKTKSGLAKTTRSGITVSNSDFQSSIYLFSSPFPYSGNDSFTPLTNDTNTISTANHFNSISSAVKAIQKYVFRICRSAPLDLADRLTGRTNKTSIGTGNTKSNIAESGGIRKLNNTDTSAVRSPVIVTLGGKITVPSFTSGYTNNKSVTWTLTSTQKTALGISSTVENVAGISFFSGTKIQSPNIASNDSIYNYDAASLSGRLEIFVNSNGTVTGTLCPSSFFTDGNTDSVFYQKSYGNVPYLLPGIWYVWVVLTRSTYTWPSSKVNVP